MYSHLDYDHWMKVRAARIEQGLSVRNGTITIEDHPLTGKKIKEISSDKEYTVVKVFKDWHYDWFTCVMFERNGSHGIIMLSNGPHCKVSDSVIMFYDRFTVL